MNKLKKLIVKYNKIFSDKYGTNFNLLDDVKCSIDSLEAIQLDCISDYEIIYKDCDYLKKYMYYLIIKKDIKNFEQFEKENKGGNQ